MMQVRDFMSTRVSCCTPSTDLREVAKIMVNEDTGFIPVCQSEGSSRPVGTITDRDIVCRAVAEGKNPLELTASDCMTGTVVTVSPEASLEDCCGLMEEKLVRRLVVVDEKGDCCGIVSQADIARHSAEQTTGEVVSKVSQETEEPARTG